MMQGVVRNIVAGKPFGFIVAKNVHYFFHRSDFKGHWEDLIRDLAYEDSISVEFEGVETEKGPRAANVGRLDHPNQAV